MMPVSSQGSESTHGAVDRAEVTDFECGAHEFRTMRSRIWMRWGSRVLEGNRRAGSAGAIYRFAGQCRTRRPGECSETSTKTKVVQRSSTQLRVSGIDSKVVEMVNYYRQLL